jgi:hypothetical protein
MLDWLVVIGLAFDILGAAALAIPVFISPQDASLLGLATVGADTEEERLEQAPVRHLINQSRWAKIGLGLLALGFLLQAIGQWPG